LLAFIALRQNFVRSSLMVWSVVIGLNPSPPEAVAVDGSVKAAAATERKGGAAERGPERSEDR